MRKQDLEEQGSKAEESERGTEMAYRSVGYFGNWAQYRQGGGKFTPDQIDPSLFTHVNFAFGMIGFVSWSVDPSPTRTGEQRYTGDYTIQPVEWNDQQVLYPAMQELKQQNPSLKTLLAIGGWSFNSCDDTPETAGTAHPYGPFTCKLFSAMAADPGGRAQFIDSVIDYAGRYGFDGIDIDWEYPGDPARGGQDADYDNCLALLSELRQAAGQDFLITMASAAVPKGSRTGDAFFQWLAQCAPFLDWFNVMAYDYHGAFDDPQAGTGANAPLLQDSSPGGTFDVKDTVESYLKASIPREKIVLGMPTYGRTYVVTQDADGYGKPFSSAGPAGPATATPGILAYYEILDKIASGELDVQRWDEPTLTPYAYSTETGLFVSYDDERSLGYKVSYVIKMGLGGTMTWAIDLDKF
ncbi:glycosyl hydrolase family 18 protein [Actinomadura terrae]|uniref:glycosyl hydrolase family 18 protein n=1 Tax=Actinomadura terrae TaxID=604353 RepID=UPI001FA7D0A9|nr:glycosyl hydrolase family 18 protein [Actinomadura terrae]